MKGALIILRGVCLVGQIFLPHQVHFSILPTSGYPLAGCSPAEPTSVSPDTFYTRFVFG
jgi:hypothetical protein